MTQMFAAVHNSYRLLGLSTLLSAAMISAAGAQPLGVRSRINDTAIGLFCSGSCASGVATQPSIPPTNSQPPRGDDTFRPTHCTAAPVIVTILRHRQVVLSRFGSMQAP